MKQMIYGTRTSAEAERATRRRISVAEIKILRKFEGKSLIEDRIYRQLHKLHKLWFKGRQIAN